MNRTIKHATVKRFYHETHDELRAHLADFVTAYNFAKRLKTLKGLTSYVYICKIWTKEPERFTLNPLHQNAGTKHLSRQLPLPSALIATKATSDIRKIRGSATAEGNAPRRPSLGGKASASNVSGLTQARPQRSKCEGVPCL